MVAIGPEDRVELLLLQKREYAGDDTELREIWSALRAEMPQYSVHMDAMTIKGRFFAAEVALKDRYMDGKGKKRAPR